MKLRNIVFITLEWAFIYTEGAVTDPNSHDYEGSYSRIHMQTTEILNCP